MTAEATCYVCGSAELAGGADPRNPLCGRCAPAREHVVSMRRAAGNKLAAHCRCGWGYVGRLEPGKWPVAAGMDRDEAVRSHWRGVIEAAA